MYAAQKNNSFVELKNKPKIKPLMLIRSIKGIYKTYFKSIISHNSNQKSRYTDYKQLQTSASWSHTFSLLTSTESTSEFRDSDDGFVVKSNWSTAKCTTFVTKQNYICWVYAFCHKTIWTTQVKKTNVDINSSSRSKKWFLETSSATVDNNNNNMLAYKAPVCQKTSEAPD